MTYKASTSERLHRVLHRIFRRKSLASRVALDKLTEMCSRIIRESMQPEDKAKKMAERQRSLLDEMIDKLAVKAVMKGGPSQ